MAATTTVTAPAVPPTMGSSTKTSHQSAHKAPQAQQVVPQAIQLNNLGAFMLENGEYKRAIATFWNALSSKDEMVSFDEDDDGTHEEQECECCCNSGSDCDDSDSDMDGDAMICCSCGYYDDDFQDEEEILNPTPFGIHPDVLKSSKQGNFDPYSSYLCERALIVPPKHFVASSHNIKNDMNLFMNAIVSFNLALAYHLYVLRCATMKDDASSLICHAARLYELSLQSLTGSGVVDLQQLVGRDALRVSMSILNNRGHALLLAQDPTSAHHCFRQLLSVLLFVISSGKSSPADNDSPSISASIERYSVEHDEYQLQGFLHTVHHLLVEGHTPPAAATA